MHCFPFSTLKTHFLFFFSLSLLFSFLLLMKFLYSNRKAAHQQPWKCCTQKTHQGPSCVKDDNDQTRTAFSDSVVNMSEVQGWKLKCAQSGWLITAITQCLYQSKSEWKKRETKKKNMQVKSYALGLGNIEPAGNLLKMIVNQSNVLKNS